MITTSELTALPSSELAADQPGRKRRHRFGDLALTLTLAAMVLLPLLEIILRQFSNGIPSAPAFLQHLTLVVGMLGGAVAAREGRLLAVSTLSDALKGESRRLAAVFSGGVAATVTAFLCLASARFVIQERAAGGTLAYDIPIWVVELVLPVGFGAISARLLWHAGETWKSRVAALMVALTLGALMGFLPMPPEQMVWPALAGLFVATLLGAPVFVTLGGAALILFWGRNVPITAVAIEHYSLVTNPALPSIPLFTLAGYFMAEGGASRRLVRVFQALVGWIRGGPAIATALICAFFTALTGGSGVTILALGGLLMPVLVSARFSERDALGLITGAGSLGILLPPCLPVILYAIVAKVDIRDMFLGGLLPGLLLILMTAGWGIWIGRRTKVDRPKFDFAEARDAMWSAKWDLLLPVVSLVALFSGWATPVEAAAVTALYAFLVEAVIYRELKLTTDCPRVMTEAGLLVGGILLIMGVAMGLTNFMVDAQIPDLLANWATEHIKSRWLFLLGLNVVLVLVGSLIEIYAAIMVITPLLVPVGLKLGIDPVHLGVIFLANMELGFLAPPIGLNLMLASSRLKRPVGEVTRAVLPLLAVMFVGVLLITYVPWFSNFLLKQPK